MYQPDHHLPPPGAPGDSHILVAPGVGFRSSVLPGGLPRGRVLNQSKSSIILKKGATFSLLKQMGSISFHMFIYARSEQYDLTGGPAYLLGPVYTTTNTQHIAIYPGKFKFILVKISPDSGRLHGRHAKENQTPVTFLLLEIYPDSSVHTSANTERIKICSVML